jgi:cytochrome b pre-mRNA-processing protein 3
MSFLSRLFSRPQGADALDPLYRAIVARAREPLWYREGGVPDTIDGRFDMVSAILALVLLRIEAEGANTAGDTVRLTEIFVNDMDGTLRQIGIGDHVVGKRVGNLMSALGGRLGAFREAADDEAFRAAVKRNIHREAPPSEEALAFTSVRLAALRDALAALPYPEILAAKVPAP